MTEEINTYLAQYTDKIAESTEYDADKGKEKCHQVFKDFMDEHKDEW